MIKLVGSDSIQERWPEAISVHLSSRTGAFCEGLSDG